MLGPDRLSNEVDGMKTSQSGLLTPIDLSQDGVWLKTGVYHSHKRARFQRWHAHASDTRPRIDEHVTAQSSRQVLRDSQSCPLSY